jgi:hypothetical protein
MAKSRHNLVPRNAAVVINTNKPNELGVNFTSDNVPYFKLEFTDSSNPFSPKRESFIVKPQTISGGVRIAYPADRAAALALALQNGFMRPADAVTACNNTKTAIFTKITEDTAEHTITDARGTKTVHGYSRIFPIGTPNSALDAEMKNQSITWTDSTLVAVEDDDTNPL